MSKNDQLLSKVLERDVNAVRQLLSEGADVNYINDIGEFALLLASKNGDIAMVEVLLMNGALINLQDSNHFGSSALYEASFDGHVDVAELLLKHGANIDIQRTTGATPLFIACEVGHFKVAELLIEKGANVNPQMNEGQTTLLIAIDRGHEEVAKLLIKNGVQVDVKYEGAFPLYYASNRKWVEVVDMLIKNGAPVDAQYNGASSLYIASSKGHVEVAKVLLENGAKIDLQYDGSSPLCIATWYGYIEVVKLLLERGAKVDLAYDSQSPLMIACQEGQTAVAKVLLDHDADTYLRNKKGQTALEIAKEKNHVDIISLFADLKEKAAYPGILFSEGVKKESIASDEKTINLEEVGASITFPENSLPTTEPPVEVAIEPCFSGSFIMPDGIESTSPAYVIKPNRKVKFEKDIVLKIRHNANLQTEEDCENMVFLSASSTPEYRGSTPVYVFKEITDTKGLFRPGQEKPLGEIQLNHFSIITTGIKLLKKIGSKIGGAKAIQKLYSARLFKTEKTAVFCMCLYQPLYMQRCENVIASKFSIKDIGQGPIEYNAVTLSSDEVTINTIDNSDWKAVFTKNPKISKREIEVQEAYQGKFEELQSLGFPPRIDIGVTLTPVTPNPKPLELRVEGLNSECIFKLLPDDFITEVNTAPISDAIKELHVEIKTQPESCSSNILTEATKMMDEMTTVESLLNNKKPTATTSILQALERMKSVGQQLRDAAQQEVQQFKVTYDMEMHIQAVNAFTKQLRVNYGANIKHTSGDTPECQAATQLFITNGANLMNSIKEVIKASKSAHALPHNQLTTEAASFSLANLLLLKWKDVDGLEHTFSLIDKVGAEWPKIGVMLGITTNKLKGMDQQHRGDVTLCWGELVGHWKKSGGTSNYPHTWDGLYKLLCDIQYSQVAEDMKKAVDDVCNSTK